MTRAVICLTTVGKAKDAERLARRLVEKRLVACVNVIPGAVSHYRWKKKLCWDREWVLLMKTAASKVKALEAELRSIHPYELPEFIVLPVSGGSGAYLRWITDSLVKG